MIKSLYPFTAGCVIALLLLMPSGNIAAQISNQKLYKLLEEIEGTKNAGKKAGLVRQVAMYYEEAGAYSKAIEYAQESMRLARISEAVEDDIEHWDNTSDIDGAFEMELAAWEYIGKLNALAGNHLASIAAYKNALQLSRGLNHEEQEKGILNALVIAYTGQENYQKAKATSDDYLKLLSSEDGNLSRAKAKYNHAIILQQLDEEEEATSYYKQAAAQYQEALGQNLDVLSNEQMVEVVQELVKINTQLGDSKAALQAVEKGIGGLTGSMDEMTASMASMQYERAYILYWEGSRELALEAIEEGLGLAETTEQLLPLKAKSYKLKSEILNAMAEFGVAQQSFKQYVALNQQLESEKAAFKKQQAMAAIAAEKEENLVKETMATKREQELALKQAQLESEKRTKELELKASQLENKELEKQRMEQALRLATQQLERQKREKEIEALEQEKALQNAALKQKELEEQERQKALKLIEAESQLKDEQLHKEEQKQKYFYIIIGLGCVFIAMVLYNLYQRSKTNKVLQAQKNEIFHKNEELQASEEELRQNMEELQVTQTILSEQKAVLEESNLKTTQSIRYGKTIQNAVLPTIEDRLRIFPKSYLLYRPKDIVSGDFFWFAEVEDGLKIAGVIDCTGHGVPGAFMSLIGTNLLNEIILQNKIYSPAMVLKKLNQGVHKSLKQNAGANDDGMDLCLATLQQQEDGRWEVVYAGAKRHLWYLEKGELKRIKGNRKSIGGVFNSEGFDYQQESLVLEEGVRLYLTTDGYVDQSNPQRKSFSTHKLNQLLEETAGLSMEHQYLRLEVALDEHQDGAEQRDDITFMCIEL